MDIHSPRVDVMPDLYSVKNRSLATRSAERPRYLTYVHSWTSGTILQFTNTAPLMVPLPCFYSSAFLFSSIQYFLNEPCFLRLGTPIVTHQRPPLYFYCTWMPFRASIHKNSQHHSRFLLERTLSHSRLGYFIIFSHEHQLTFRRLRIFFKTLHLPIPYTFHPVYCSHFLF